MDNVTVTGGKKYEAVLQKLSEIKMGLKGGVLKNATTSDGKHIADYAAYNEYGTTRIPSRPFLRTTAKEKSNEWSKVLSSRVKNNSSDRGAWEAGLTLTGESMKANIIETIQKGEFPANASSTVEAKRRKGKTEPDHPLIDTGQLLQAIAYEVIK